MTKKVAFQSEVQDVSDAASSLGGRVTSLETSSSSLLSRISVAESKLSGIQNGATANSSDSYLLSRTNHTGTQSADTLIDGSTNKVYTGTEKTKLSGIAAGATANSADSFLLDRTNHTGTQSADTIVDGTTNKAYTATEKTKLAGLATQVQADWSQASSSAVDFVKNKPTIPAAQVQVDFAQTNTASVDFVKNKPVQQSAITNATGTCASDAPTNSPSDASTSYGVLTAILGTDINTTNAKQNQTATNVNSLATKYNATAVIVNNIETKLNNMLSALRGYGVLAA